jgi:hypothetical protein
LLPEPGPDVRELSGPELLALHRELKTEGQSYIAVLEVVGISGWRATIRPLPKPLPIQIKQKNAHEKTT